LTNIYLIRHGDSIEELKDGIYQELGLSLEGVRQTEFLKDRLVRTGTIKADILISSPLQRACESAQILAPALGQPVILDEDLREWQCDDGQISPEEFDARWQEIPESHRPFTRWMAGYETWLEFSVRVQQALNRILQEHEGKSVVLITHGGVI
jgi:2,3-bisphosphoglycerate-dependent phosphoglycerate mutase